MKCIAEYERGPSPVESARLMFVTSKYSFSKFRNSVERSDVEHTFQTSSNTYAVVTASRNVYWIH